MKKPQPINSIIKEQIEDEELPPETVLSLINPAVVLNSTHIPNGITNNSREVTQHKTDEHKVKVAQKGKGVEEDTIEEYKDDEFY